MGIANSKHITTNRDGDSQGVGNYATLHDYLNRKIINTGPFAEVNVAVSSAQYVLISTTHITGPLAIGTGSNESDGGLVASQLAGAVGSAATTNISDSLGNVVNIVEVRDATSNDPVYDGSGRKVYGLFQAASTANDGDMVGAPASENCQISFIILDADSVITLTALNGTYEFSYPKLYADRHLPAYRKEGATHKYDVIQPTAVNPPLVRKYMVTTAFTAGEVITISTGAGSGSGASTTSGDTISSIGATANDFNTTNTTKVKVSGLSTRKGTDATWDTSTSFHFSVPLDVSDWFEVEVAQ